MMAAPDWRVPGWYGKIPALGDFASRRLPTSTVAAWDAWLQDALAASRAELYQRWLDVYLAAPIWRFVLLPGVIGTSAWAGLIMPSVDKVGRHFPLVITVALDGQQADSALAAPMWYDQLEQLALDTLDTDFSLEALEAELAALPFPAAPNEVWSKAQELANWCRDPSPAQAIALPDLATLPRLRTTTAQHTLVTHGFGKSLWWTTAETAGSSRLCCFVGLPPSAQFADFLEGTMLRVGMD